MKKLYFLLAMGIISLPVFAADHSSIAECDKPTTHYTYYVCCTSSYWKEGPMWTEFTSEESPDPYGLWCEQHEGAKSSTDCTLKSKIFDQREKGQTLLGCKIIYQ